jgi:hypothetical protein
MVVVTAAALPDPSVINYDELLRYITQSYGYSKCS